MKYSDLDKEGLNEGMNKFNSGDRIVMDNDLELFMGWYIHKKYNPRKMMKNLIFILREKGRRFYKCKTTQKVPAPMYRNVCIPYI